MSSKIQRTNPVHGQNQAEFFNIVQSLNDSVGYERQRYLNYFRPPTLQEEPLVANVSLKSPLVEIQFDKSGSQTLELSGNLVREYLDSRLEYDGDLLPKGKKFLELPPEAYSLRVWGPVLKVLNYQDASADFSSSSYELEQERRTPRVLVTPEGHVNNSQAASFKLRCTNLAKKGEDEPLEFKLVLSEDKETVESVKLQWNASKALIDSIQSIKELKTAEGDKIHKVESISVTCSDDKTRTEELGDEFGSMTFSVLDLTIRIKLVKEEKKPDEEKDKEKSKS